MTWYSVALFAHVSGAAILFMALTLEGFGLHQLRKAAWASVDAPQKWEEIARLTRTLARLSALAVLIPGVYMTIATWGLTAWIAVGAVAWAVILAFGIMNGIRVTQRLRAAVRFVGASSSAALMRIPDSVASVSWRVRVGMAFAVIFTMTNKPQALVGLLVIVGGGIVSFLVGNFAGGAAPS